MVHINLANTIHLLICSYNYIENQLTQTNPSEIQLHDAMRTLMKFTGDIFAKTISAWKDYKQQWFINNNNSA